MFFHPSETHLFSDTRRSLKNQTMDLKHQVTWGSSRARSGGCWGVRCVLIWSWRYIFPKPGIVWETYHQGVPLLGVPENPNDFWYPKLNEHSNLKKGPWMEDVFPTWNGDFSSPPCLVLLGYPFVHFAGLWDLCFCVIFFPSLGASELTSLDP